MDHNTSFLVLPKLFNLENKILNILDTHQQKINDYLALEESHLFKAIQFYNQLKQMDKMKNIFLNLYVFYQDHFRGLECELYVTYFFEICFFELSMLNIYAGQCKDEKTKCDDTKQKIALKFILVFHLVNNCKSITFTDNQQIILKKQYETILDLSGYKSKLDILYTTQIQSHYDENIGNNNPIFSLDNSTNYAVVNSDSFKLSTLHFVFSWDSPELSVTNILTRYENENEQLHHALSEHHKIMEGYVRYLVWVKDLVKSKNNINEPDTINKEINLLNLDLNLFCFISSDLLMLEVIKYIEL